MDLEQEWLKEVQSGTEAKYLLEAPLLQKILRDLREQTISTWRETKMNQVDARENSYHLMLAIDLLENSLRAYQDGGEVAEEKLKTRKPRKTKTKGE